MVSCPAAQFSILVPGCVDSLAGCPHSAQRGWLIICQPLWGMRPACQQRAQCFSGQRSRLESEADLAPLQAKGGWGAKGSKWERVVFLGLSHGGNVAQTVYSKSHGYLGLTEGALVAYYVCQPQYINTKAQSSLMWNIYFFTSGRMHDVPLMAPVMQRTSMFSQSERCCATMFPPLQVKRLTRGNLQTNRGSVVSGLQNKTCFFRFLMNQNIRTKKITSAFTQVDSPLLSVVQTALCYTIYLLPTQLQEAPPSLHHQQHNMRRVFSPKAPSSA